MSLRALLTEKVGVWRKSDVIRALGTISSVMYLDSSLPSAVKLLCKVSGGTTGSGTLTILGTVGGVGDSQILTFTTNGFKETTKSFSAVSSITESGFTDESIVPSLEIFARSAAGQPVYLETLRFYRKMRIEVDRESRYRFAPAGQLPEITHRGYAEYLSDQIIQEKDIIIGEEGSKFEVLPFDIVDARNSRFHHLELSLKRVL
mgnify:CR=1 FL=1